jgi:prepilin-type N-terminal cleavage/methylation domain-containing protein
MTNFYRSSRHSRRAGFSLVEMIGVLAIIAILAVVIVPKVFSTIASSRVTHAVGSVTSVKSAVTEFAGKYGTVPVCFGNNRLDDLLVTAGMLESRLLFKIGAQPPTPPPAGGTWTYANGAWAAAGGTAQGAQSRAISRNFVAAAPSAAAGQNYQLDGTTDLPAGSRVISVWIDSVRAAEARDLSQRIDGESLSAANTTVADDDGKVVYAAPNAAGITDVYIYVAHQ